MTRRPFPFLAIRRLHRDERGSLSPMILTVTIVLAYMIVWILNTGQTIYDKQRTQDTADAVALVHADWTARSLNIMAMNNVAASQALVVGATSAALEVTALDLAKRSGQILLKLKDYTTSWGWGPPSLVPPMPPMPHCPYYQAIVIDFGIIHKACVAFQLFRGTMALAAEGYVVYVHAYYNPVGIAWKSGQIINAMNALNDDLVERLPERIAVNAQTLTTVNKADHVVFHPPCKDAASCDAAQEGQGADLPVQRHVSFADPFAYKEMCIAAEHGTSAYPAPAVPFTPNMRGAYEKRGFPVGTGPLTAGGKGDKPHIRDHVNAESGMASWLPAWQDFYDIFGPAYYTGISFSKIIKKYLPEDAKFDVEIFGVSVFDWEDAMDLGMGVLEKAFNMKFGVVNPFQLPIDTPPRYEESQDADENDFTRTFDDTWDQVCGGSGGLLSLVGVLPQPYWLKGRDVYAMDPALTRIDKDDQLKDYRSLAVVSRKPRGRLQQSLFKDATPSAFAFAESWTHNYTAFDLYTQDWRAALAPASLADDQNLADTLRQSPAASAFDTLANTLDQGGTDGLVALTSH